ncbi:hypothetical protein AYL99_02428 [Fonsecaea erecta]|uniref:Uncharacterized protein n=1 Tax=Fonsecaea erecta TaxID=1367422 RepID=A0A178ZUR7_9EURO|nr:hypothetical protein AYL99_02428 [Fonsecaea erecta]OAP63201.1 hypothetical protein AYL99_02428 [Fonsecaea erecta]
MQNNSYLGPLSKADPLIDLSKQMETSSQPANESPQLLQQPLQDVSSNVSADKHLQQGGAVLDETLQEVACQPKDVAHPSDKSSGSVRDDPAVPDCVSRSIDQFQVTDSEAGVMTMTDDNVRAAIRKDLQSGRFEIPPFTRADNIDAPIENLARRPFPPALMATSSHSRHRQRFDRSALLPDSNLPFCAQIMEHVKDWAEWGTRIADEQRRKEVLDHVFEVLSKAWFEALRLGYNPGTPDTKSTAPQVSTKRSAQRQDDVPVGLPRGKPRLRRETSPSKMPFLVANHKDGPSWAITAGELEEAGVSESRVRSRTAAANTPELGEELLNKVLNDLGGRILPSDWHRIMDVTRLNPMGRDLMVYCLYEALKLRKSLANLWELYNHFPTARQKENTKRRIDAEQELHDLFMALALELNEENPSPEESTTATPLTSPEGSVGVQPATVEPGTDSLNQPDVLMQLTETILRAPDVASILSGFGLFHITEDDLVTAVSTGASSSSLDRCKQILKDLLFEAREYLILSENAELNTGRENIDLGAQIQTLEREIRLRKEALKDLLSSLVVERNDISDSVDRSTAPGEDRSAVTSTATDPTDDVLTETMSRKSSENTAKHHLDASDGENPLPPTKRPKADHGAEGLDHSILMPDDGLTSDNIHEASIHEANIHETAARNSKEGLDANSGCHADTALKETPNDGRVTLRISPHFNPADFTVNRVFCHPTGFRYRYTNESTLAQRRSMADILENHIRYVMQEHEYVGFNSKYDPGWRFGRYQILAHPDDPERTSIIHGIWDLENGDQPEGFEWFYRGGDMRPSEHKEGVTNQDEEAERGPAVAPPPKRKTHVLKRKNALDPGQEASRSATGDANDTPMSSHSKEPSIRVLGGKNKKRSKGKHRHVHFSAEEPAVARPDWKNPVSLSRPKRKTGVIKPAKEESDEDYCPSE